MAVVSLAVAALPIAVLRLIRGKQFWQLHWFQSSKERMIGYLSSVLSGRGSAKELRVFELNGYLMERWLQLRQQVREEQWEFERKNIWREFIMGTATTEVFAYALGSAIAIRAAITDQLELGGLAAALVALRTFQDKVRHSLIDAVSAAEGARFASDLFRFLDDPEEERLHSGLSIPVPLQDGIRLEQLEFQYPGIEQPVLHDISCHIRPKERIAIVGVNGAGKSTLVKLILGLYKPTKGKVTYDGVDVAQLDPAEFRTHLSVVMQDFVRYEYTVRDNISFGDIGNPNIAKSTEKSAVDSGVAEFAKSLMDGYDTRLGKQFPDSTDLSGGQWQRVATARGYMRDPQVLVLDEPTSALDPLREAEVYRNFFEMGKNCISLIVSHRLGSCKLADRIFVLDDHRLAEVGTHEELMRMDGVYAGMYKDQAEWYMVGTT